MRRGRGSAAASGRREPGDPEASGGTLNKLEPWLPEDSRLTAKGFSYELLDG
jgi:hypothetical protein